MLSFTVYPKLESGYLVRPVLITNPSTGKKMVFKSNTPIRVNLSTNIAWIGIFQVEIARQSYCLVQ